MPTSSDTFAIRAEGLGKEYRIGAHVAYRTLRETMVDAAKGMFRRATGGGREPSPTVWALKDVSFEIAPGESIGIIGRNGAGKSTLLKILSRITHPTCGSGEIRGRLGSLLEVGTGFHPELSGRENIFLSGVILGMRKAEISRQLDEIVAFAGIERFVDTPVKRYSSGMYTRLAFSVAAHLQTEILLVDEVLAVGDAGFQFKCLNKMSELSGSGRTVLFVSHNMEAVAKLCERAILLEDGQVDCIAPAQDAIARYLTLVRSVHSQQGAVVSLRNHPGRTKHHNGPVRVVSLRIEDEQGQPTWEVECGRALNAVIGYELAPNAGPQDVSFALTISNSLNFRLAHCRSHDTHLAPMRIIEAGEARCRLARLPLVAGSYGLTPSCNTEAGFSDGVYNAATLEVTGQGFYPSGLTPNRLHGEVLFDHEWEVVASRATAAAGGGVSR